jgi:S1-C subfamily serine protease
MKGLAEQQERLGFRIAQREPEPNAAWSAYYLRDLGVVVRPVTHAVSVAKGSPAGKAGILPGSEIVRIGDVVLQSAWHARGLLTRTRPGDIRAVTFRQNGVFRTARIRLAPLPSALAATELHPNQGWLGVEFESAARVVAVAYQDGTPHLELGDDIIKVDRSDFDGVDGLARWFARNADGTIVELQVRRRGQFMVMALEKLR